MKSNVKETKEAIMMMNEKKLDAMRTKLAGIITEKAAEALNERKIQVAQNYFRG